MKEIVRSELKETKKDLFVAKRNCVLAYTKAAAIILLCGFGPTTAVAAVGSITSKQFKEETVEVPYLEEVILDNQGNEQRADIKEGEKQSSFYKEYTDCSSLDGKYVVSYNLYTGDDVTYENVELVNTYEVPAEKVFELSESGIEKVDHSIDKGYSVARVYRTSDNTYERKIQKGDDAYTHMKIFEGTKMFTIGFVSTLCLRKTFFREDSVFKNVVSDLQYEDYSSQIDRKRSKVKTLERKIKEE
jgi:hypothetical protein